MANILITICDMCGKRTDVIKGKMVITEFRFEKGSKTKVDKYHPYTKRSWQLCQKCLNKICAIELIGDIVRQDIEMQIDKLRVSNNQSRILIPEVISQRK